MFSSVQRSREKAAGVKQKDETKPIRKSAEAKRLLDADNGYD